MGRETVSCRAIYEDDTTYEFAVEADFGQPASHVFIDISGDGMLMQTPVDMHDAGGDRATAARLALKYIDHCADSEDRIREVIVL